MEKKSRKSLIALVLLLLVGVVGGTIAYFTSSAKFDNIFQTSTYGTTYKEEFVAPTNWQPGDVTDKTLTVKNDGSVNVAVRVKMTEAWLAADGVTNPGLTIGDQTVALVHLANTNNWVKVGDWYYYTAEVTPGNTTLSFIESVEFNPAVKFETAEGNCETSDDKLTVTCTSADTGHQGATYTLTLEAETIQVEGMSTWGVQFDETAGVKAVA